MIFIPGSVRLICLAMVVVLETASADVLVGFPLPSASRRLVLKDQIVNIIVRKDVCHILFSQHQAYFHFPIANMEILAKLKSIRAQHQPLTIEYDGTDLNISKIEF